MENAVQVAMVTSASEERNTPEREAETSIDWRVSNGLYIHKFSQENKIGSGIPAKDTGSLEIRRAGGIIAG